MDTKFYLLNFEVCGIRNIEKPISISFYKKTILNDFDFESYKIKAIYGENGSGKTSIIAAVKILQNLLLDKTFLSDGERQKTLVESINKKTKSGYIRCEFYCERNEKKYICRYYVEFEVREDGRVYINGEKYDVKLGTYSKNAYVSVFETKNGELIYYFDKESYDFLKNKTQNLLDLRCFSTCIFDDEIYKRYMQDEQLNIDDVYYLFDFAATISVFVDERENSVKNLEREKYFPDYRGGYMPKVFLKAYEKKVAGLVSFIKIFKPDLVDIVVDTRDYNADLYKFNLRMVYKDYSLDSEYESNGIKKLMNLFGYLDAAAKGYIVLIDELDSNINDVYLDKIIEHFVLYGKGQLCFTAHNLSPMAILKGRKSAITFVSGINTIHTWANTGNASPENAYRNGFIEDSPFNVDASSFLGIIGGEDEP